MPDSADETDGSLEKPSSGGAGWDQFATNERLFGLKSDYDENIYTTTIDKNHPQYRERMAAAERKAREIERSVPVTAHVAEERIMDFVGANDQRDEEDKYAHLQCFQATLLTDNRYSGVRRQQDFPPLSSRDNKYTPPARRAPTGQATVKGAPVDPAIISSQLKSLTPKQPVTKADESKPAAQTTVQVNKAPAAPTAENKTAESKPEAKPTAVRDAEVKNDKPADKTTASARPSATTSRTSTPKDVGAAPSATATVERDVLTHFKSFASQQRLMTQAARGQKIKQDKEVKLNELKTFANNFKLSTPVPKDLIGIIAKDPVKQKAIQEKALQNAEELAKEKAETARKEKEAQLAKENQAKAIPEQSVAAPTAPTDNRNVTRPSGPQHASPASLPGRHPGPRTSYNPQNHYQQYGGRNNRGGAHMGTPGQQTGNLAQRIRSQMDQKPQHQHLGQHPPHAPHAGAPDMRIPPTGPANSADPSFRRVASIQPSFMSNKLNPNSHEFRPNAYAPAFLPAGPSQGSSPRSSVNNVVEPPHPPTPVPGQLIRRKTKAVDVKKCLILSHIQTLQPPVQSWSWEQNDGLRPSWDTPPTWRQLKDEAEKPDSTMNLTYKEYFEKMLLPNAAVATPNPSHVMPLPHQHQLPFHLQHGAQNLAPRQSPHLPPMQMHAGQHGHAPHVQFNNSDDHRMMHSNSAQSFASPRMGQVPMAYPPAMGTPGQMPYSQPVMPQYIQSGAPPMGQYRSFSNNPQYMGQQSHHLGNPMLVQPQFIPGPNGMVAAAPQVSMYSGHPQFIPPNTVPPQPMGGSSGFPSPSRPAAPMMAHQNSHQGQQAVYGMSPGMPYQQPVYPPQQGQTKFSGQRPQ